MFNCIGPKWATNFERRVSILSDKTCQAEPEEVLNTMLGATRFPHNCFAHHGQDADTYRPTETQHGLVTDCTRANNGLGTGLSRTLPLRTDNGRAAR
jgi:hypothetical protein